LAVDLLPNAIRQRVGVCPNLTDESAAEAVRSAIADVSEQVHSAALETPGTDWLGLGATVALALVDRLHVLLAHLGDSRIYILRQGRLESMTRDHSYVEELIQLGKVARADVEGRGINGGPTRFVGMAGQAIAETRLVELDSGDRLLLCTDGLTCMLDDLTIQRILKNHRDLEEACRALVATANRAGGED